MKYIRNAKPRPTKRGRDESKDMTTEGLNEREEEPPTKKTQKEFKQFPRSPAAPLIPPGEDKPSHLRHLKKLQREESKVTSDKRIISDLMTRTYPFRRQEILEKPQPIGQLAKTYPSIRRSEQV